MIDLEYFGSRFTWQGKRRNVIVSKRLDRGVGDYRWRMNFPEATVENLMKRQSDHNPLLLRCHHMDTDHHNRPIRFQAKWCTHKDYLGVVKHAWGDSSDVFTDANNVSKDSLIEMSLETFY